jgi:hypothetical protein
MKKPLIFLFVSTFHLSLLAQKNDLLSNPIFAIRLDMHGYVLPFSKGLSAKNIGVSLGMQIPYNQKGTLTQSVWVGVVNHHLSGKQAYAYTQLGVHPFPNSPVDFGFNLGLGYARAISGSPTYTQQPDGNWQNASRHKGGLMIPVGVQLGWRGVQMGRASFSPFVSYQFQPVLGLSDAAPILPNTLLSIGNRFKF